MLITLKIQSETKEKKKHLQICSLCQWSFDHYVLLTKIETNIHIKSTCISILYIKCFQHSSSLSSSFSSIHFIRSNTFIELVVERWINLILFRWIKAHKVSLSRFRSNMPNWKINCLKSDDDITGNAFDMIHFLCFLACNSFVVYFSLAFICSYVTLHEWSLFVHVLPKCSLKDQSR